MDVTQIQKREIIGQAGGLVDSISVALCLSGETLDPDIVTQRLGCAPSTSHQKGDPAGPRSPEFERGAWILAIEGVAPRTADELFNLLLGRLSIDNEFWRALSRDCDVKIRCGI